MILRYKGVEHIDPRFIAKTDDLVDFTEQEATEKLKSPEWEVFKDGNTRKSRKGTNPDN
jgi:hypothetical protein